MDGRYRLVALTVFAAMILSALPIPQWAHVFWPEWVLLVVIYWCLAMPERLNIKFAWFVGILSDLLEGSLLGQHALLYTLIAWLTTYFYQRLRLYPPHQQVFFIALLLLIYIKTHNACVFQWYSRTTCSTTPTPSLYQLACLKATLQSSCWQGVA